MALEGHLLGSVWSLRLPPLALVSCQGCFLYLLLDLDEAEIYKMFDMITTKHPQIRFSFTKASFRYFYSKCHQYLEMGCLLLPTAFISYNLIKASIDVLTPFHLVEIHSIHT